MSPQEVVDRILERPVGKAWTTALAGLWHQIGQSEDETLSQRESRTHAIVSAGLLRTFTSPRVESAAWLSPRGTYRYSLDRRWGRGQPLIFVMLNPSTADAAVDDPTIRRCMGFARREGFGGIHVVNLFALRSTKPKALLDADAPVGSENFEAFERVCTWPHEEGEEQPPIVLAWGAIDRRLAHQVDTALGWLAGHEDRFRVLGFTAAGYPRHPLFVRGDAPLLPWRPDR